MPEGPELRLSSIYVNTVCTGRTFTGNVIKSTVSKNPEVSFSSLRYTISAESRGKELALVLSSQEENESTTRLLFRFGMSGQFKFTLASDLPKHAHLQFYTTDDPQYALSFVDVRRFGSWRVCDGWGENRGPDPMNEYEEFKKNVLDNLKDSVFNRPICEVLLNQKYFNGIGNYLRAEIIYRSGFPPFESARRILTNVKKEEDAESDSSCFLTGDSFLQLCHDVPHEVVNLRVEAGVSAGSEDGLKQFKQWLRCYDNLAMNNLVDHNGRTIWFQGSAGPLAPKVRKIRSRKHKPATTVVKVEVCTDPEPKRLIRKRAKPTTDCSTKKMAVSSKSRVSKSSPRRSQRLKSKNSSS